MKETTNANGNGTATVASERLPVSLKLAFGSPAFAGAAMGIPIGVLMPRFYSDVVLAPLGYIAIAIALARAFDALTDPVMGWLSDRTRTRWGRRKPYIAAGLPFTALAFYMLFAPPEGLTPTQASLWFGAAFGLYFFFHTILDIPLGALGAEVTLDYRERSSLFGYRSFFIAAGTIVGSIMPAILASGVGMSDERSIFSLMAGIYAFLYVILYGWLLIRVPERPEFVRREPNPLIPGVRRALRNRPFRILLFAGIVGAIPAAIPAILMPYFVGYVLQPADPGTWVSMFLLIYLGTGLVFIPFWIAVAKRIGKLRTFITASVIGIVGSVFYFFCGAGDTLFAGCIFFMTGTASMAGTFLIPAMAADVIDYDELRTGKRREAQYTAFWAIILKFVAIPGSAIPLAILAVVGYVPNQVQTGEVLFWLRFIYSIFPVVFYVTALAIISRYPISEAIHAKIRRGVGALAAGGSTTDPLTGRHLSPRGAGRVSESDGWFLDYFSPGELRRALGGRANRIVTSVLAAGGISLFVCLGASLIAVTGLTDPGSDPPLSTVFAVVLAGLAFTAFVFHGLRLSAARRMARDPLPDEVVRAHLGEEIDADRARGSA